MKGLNYTKFIEVYKQLSEECQFIIFNLLQNLEHNKDEANDKIDYKRGLSIAMSEQELSTIYLATLLKKNDSCPDQREAVTSMIERGSKTSDFFKDTLDILNIDEVFLIQNSEYFQSRINNIEWCFNSLSEQNKEAVYFLTSHLTDLKGVTALIEFLKHPSEIVNCGVDTE